MAQERSPERLETYLKDVRKGLRGLPVSEIDEIVLELRSHVLDRLGGDFSDAKIAQALARLGELRAVARMNLSTRIAMQAVDRASPAVVFATMLRLARLSLNAVLAFLLSLVGYGFAACWLFVAIAKPFAPGRIGLWLLPDPTGDLSFSLGSRTPSLGMHDLLGWWIIPLGLAIGFVAGFITYRFDRHVIKQVARREREELAL